MHGSRNSARGCGQKSLPMRQLSVRLTVHATLPCRSRRCLCDSSSPRSSADSSAAAPWPSTTRFPDYKTFAAALDAIEANYVGTVRIRQPRLQRDSRDARHARPAFELLRSARPTRRCASGRKAATTASASRFRARPRATSSRPACSKVRPRTRKASGAATRSPRSATRTPRAGRPSRRCRSCAVPRGRRCTSSCRRRGYEQSIPLDVTRDEVYIPTVPATFMFDATTGYIKLQDFGENTDRDLKRALRDLTSQGDEASGPRYPRQSRGPLDQAIKVTNEFLPSGQDDRLHARPRFELGSGLSRHRGRRVHRHPDCR